MRHESSQRGAALVSVIFLIVAVAALGAFAIRTGADYRQQANLSLQEVRAAAAAYSGVEYASNRLNGVAACVAGPTLVPIQAGRPGMGDITVRFTCAAIGTGGSGTVFDVTATARSGAFGSPDYVQRVSRRRVGAIGGGASW